MVIMLNTQFANRGSYYYVWQIIQPGTIIYLRYYYGEKPHPATRPRLHLVGSQQCLQPPCTFVKRPPAIILYGLFPVVVTIQLCSRFYYNNYYLSWKFGLIKNCQKLTYTHCKTHSRQLSRKLSSIQLYNFVHQTACYAN